MIRLRHPAALGLGPAFGAGLGFLIGLVLIVALGDQIPTNSDGGREGAAVLGIGLRVLLVGATTLVGGLVGLVVGTILAPPPYNAIGAFLLVSLAAAVAGWWILRAPQRCDQAFLNAVAHSRHA